MSTQGRTDPLIVALDFDRLETALQLVSRLGPAVRLYKIGLQLYTRCGPECVRAVRETGADVFLDLKLHDIPNTVYKAVVEICRLDVRFFTVHASGGLAMMRAAQKAVLETPEARRPCVLGVSVLTSLDGRACREEIGFSAGPEELVPAFARRMREAGIGGLVCSPDDIARVRAAVGDALRVVTPGVRPAWAETGDHARDRVLTPRQALERGADYLVVGRPVTGHADPVEAVGLIRREIG